MELADILPPEHVFPAVDVHSRKSLFEFIADRAAMDTGLDARSILDALNQRERLGCTGFGKGVSLPHARLKELSRIHAWFMRLKEPIDFDAPDGIKVDLVGMILTPDNAASDHLKALNSFARRLREPGVIKQLRGTAYRERMYQLLVDDDEVRLAAAQ